MNIPQEFENLDWWYSPFELGGYHAPMDDYYFADPSSLRRFKRKNTEVFQSFVRKSLRHDKSIIFCGQESLIWYFESCLSSAEWGHLFDFFWHGEIKKKKRIAVFCEVLNLLKENNYSYWISGVSNGGIIIEVPKNAKDRILCNEVAKIMRKLHGGEMTDKVFIEQFLNVPDVPIWDLTYCESI